MENGFIKIFRQIQDWEWYTDSETVHFFLHCILSANWKEKRWQGKVIERGQFVTSYANLSMQTGLSIKQVRLRVDRLVDSGEIEYEGANNYSVVTVCKYDTYQPKHSGEGQAKDNQKTIKGQSKGNQRATTKEGKEREEGKELKNNTTVISLEDDVPSASDSETWLASVRISEYLLEAICEYDASHKYASNKPSLKGWAKQIDLALRRDGRTEEQFKYLIDAVFRNNNQFHDLWDKWPMNIQSGKTLRDQFDKLKNQIQTSKNKTNGYSAKPTKGDYHAEVLRRL